LPIIEADIYSGQVVIASEYAPDGSLDSWLKRYSGKAPSLESAVEIASGILAGLEHLHAQHIIHRDLKPANILLQGGTPRIADFGISRALRSTSHSNIAAGTPAYMAPEAFEGKRSLQTDIWSAGVILYQLFSGSLPFQGSDIASLMADIITHEPRPLPSTVPGQLQEIVGQFLHKSPSERKSATEMQNALRHASISIRTTRSITTVQETPLAEIRRQMLVSNSIWQLQESLYKVDEYLSRYPHQAEARMLRDQILKAIKLEEVMRVRPGASARSPQIGAPLLLGSKQRLILVIIVVVLLAVSFYFLLKWLF
jgi:serine/threonine protein kinase